MPGDSEPGDESQPGASELADRIKALKAEHTIEAMPQWVGTRRATAEELITARIRRRAEAIPAADPTISQRVTPTGTFSPGTGTTEDWTSRAAGSIRQEREARSR